NLGNSARVIMTRHSTNDGKSSEHARQTRICRQLRSASVQVYERKRSAPGSARSNFAVVCDRWGTPVSIWSGSTAWTLSAFCLHANNGIIVESVPLARAYLDRWEFFLASRGGKGSSGERRKSAHAHVRERGTSTTVWNSPLFAQADLRDASRLIR